MIVGMSQVPTRCYQWNAHVGAMVPGVGARNVLWYLK